ncbi:MAG TPA: hypothetical protein VFB08_04500 [Burkholderiales bacterium]|nr:hypothetical protein [Burkholderiales bacterium]
MLSVVFLAIAAVTGAVVFGAGNGVGTDLLDLSKVLFAFFLVAFVVSVIARLIRGRGPGL